jgi:hypothetical protein
VASYEERASALVLSEAYEQHVTQFPNAFQERRLRSEIAILSTADVGWMGFRDVVEVDGRAVQDRQDRLQKLFARLPTTGVVERARAVAAESARFNLGSVGRDLNYPTMALMFLRQAYQHRSTFSLGGEARLGQARAWVIRFEETARPTLIGTIENGRRTGDVRASGQYWIEADSGRIPRSELTVELEHATAIYEVAYGEWTGVDVLVPLTMEENVSVRASARGARSVGDIRPIEVLRGRARYENVRRFNVSVDASTGQTPP